MGGKLGIYTSQCSKMSMNTDDRNDRLSLPNSRKFSNTTLSHDTCTHTDNTTADAKALLLPGTNNSTPDLTCLPNFRNHVEWQLVDSVHRQRNPPGIARVDGKPT